MINLNFIITTIFIIFTLRIIIVLLRDILKKPKFKKDYHNEFLKNRLSIIENSFPKERWVSIKSIDKWFEEQSESLENYHDMEEKNIMDSFFTFYEDDSEDPYLYIKEKYKKLQILDREAEKIYKMLYDYVKNYKDSVFVLFLSSFFLVVEIIYLIITEL